MSLPTERCSPSLRETGQVQSKPSRDCTLPEGSGQGLTGERPTRQEGFVAHGAGLRQEAPLEQHDEGRLHFEAGGGALGPQDGRLTHPRDIQSLQILPPIPAPRDSARTWLLCWVITLCFALLLVVFLGLSLWLLSSLL